MKCRLLFVVSFLFFGLTIQAKDDVVEATYDYIMPSDVTPLVARTIAVERAKLEALAQKYGTIITQANSIMMANENARSKTSFYSLGDSEVRGEWRKTIDEKVEEMIVDGLHVIRAWVKGEAREVKFAKVNFETHLLRNGKGDEYESEDYRDGDNLYISFRSPAKGYLAVYLLDADQNANRLVPDPDDDEELCPVKRGERYVFLDDENNRTFLTTDRQQEINKVYVIFSPNKFYPEPDEQNMDNSDLAQYKKGKYTRVYRLPFIPFKKFQKWIVKLRNKDPEVQVVTKFVKISN